MSLKLRFRDSRGQNGRDTIRPSKGHEGRIDGLDGMSNHHRPNPKAIDQASKSDRVWFAGHPGVSRRIRPVIPGEAGDLVPECTHVIVTRICDGIRHKKFVDGTEL